MEASKRNLRPRDLSLRAPLLRAACISICAKRQRQRQLVLGQVLLICLASLSSRSPLGLLVRRKHQDGRVAANREAASDRSPASRQRMILRLGLDSHKRPIGMRMTRRRVSSLSSNRVSSDIGKANVFSQTNSQRLKRKKMWPQERTPNLKKVQSRRESRSPTFKQRQNGRTNCLL